MSIKLTDDQKRILEELQRETGKKPHELAPSGKQLLKLIQEREQA
jgi:hypothetical protein